MKNSIKIFLIAIAGLFYSLPSMAGKLIDIDDKLSEEVKNNAGFSSEITLGSLMAGFIQVALSFLGIIFFSIAIGAGFKLMTAGDNADEIKKLKKNIQNAIIGIVIVLAAYAITHFLFSNLPFFLNTSNGTGTTSGL